MKVRVKRIGSHTLPLPKYETEGAAGFDLRARVVYSEVAKQSPSACGDMGGVGYVYLEPGDRVMVPCGFAFEVPSGFELQVRPRSSMNKQGVHVALGTIDSDYRGEVHLVVINLGYEEYRLNDGDRIAQGVIAPVVRAELEEAEELSETERGGNGFGSTGHS